MVTLVYLNVLLCFIMCAASAGPLYTLLLPAWFMGYNSLPSQGVPQLCFKRSIQVTCIICSVKVQGFQFLDDAIR